MATGFLEYGSTDPAVIEFASFTSSGDIGSFAMSGGAATFDADGMLLGADSLCGTTDPTFLAAIASGFTLTLWVENEYFSKDLNSADTSSRWLLRIIDNAVSNGGIEKNESAGGLSRISGTQGGNVSGSDALLDNLLPGESHWRVDISTSTSHFDIYVNYMLVSSADWNAAWQDIATLYIGGQGQAGIPNLQQKVKNVQWTNTQIDLSLVDNTSFDITVIGDELVAKNAYQTQHFVYLGYAVDYYSDSSVLARDLYYQQQWVPELHASLNSLRTHAVAGQIPSFGREGTAFRPQAGRPMSERCDAFEGINGEHPQPAKNWSNIIILMAGANDADHLSNGWTTIDDIELGIQTTVDRLAQLCDNLFICTVPERSNGKENIVETQQINQYIRGLEAWDSRMTVVDIHPYTTDGAWTDDGTYPNQIGNKLFADMISEAIRYKYIRPIVSNVQTNVVGSVINVTCDSDVVNTGNLYAAIRNDRAWYSQEGGNTDQEIANDRELLVSLWQYTPTAEVEDVQKIMPLSSNSFSLGAQSNGLKYVAVVQTDGSEDGTEGVQGIGIGDA